MEESLSAMESANSGSLSAHGLFILYSADAQEWATYLQNILKSSGKFHKSSIVLHVVGPADFLRGYNFESFRSCKCVVLVLMGELLDMLYEPKLQGALQTVLHPPHRVVALMSDMSEDHNMMEIFEDWLCWRKLSAMDEPTVFISTILESITDRRHQEAEPKREAVKGLSTATSSTASTASDRKEEVMSSEPRASVLTDEPENAGDEIHTTSHLTCLTVQPSRVLCGERETLYIVFRQRVANGSVPEVEFSSGDAAAERVPAAVENEFTLSVKAPDMPAGVVSLTMYTDRSCISLRPVTYYTSMGEVSRYLENATDPVSFICQAFNLTSNSCESVDKILTQSLKSRIPATSLQLFGVRQIEEENMGTYQRTEELPTLLHFAAKYGLKKLTTVLMQCPGALQAYSVMNKHGDYPNTLAEKNGFSDLRQFMDEFVETADMLNIHFEDSINPEEHADVYELMSASSQDIILKYSSCSEDVYESMLGIDPECAEDLYEVMSAVDENPEEAILRKFFQGKPPTCVNQDNRETLRDEEAEKEDHEDLYQPEETKDPYSFFPDDIYYTVQANSTCDPVILNRPPAPIPRSQSEHETPMIHKVFSAKSTSGGSTALEMRNPAARPSSPVYDHYAGMKTPGQRQLISLQERVKVGEITVDDAVREFKAWQFDHEHRANSVRYQQDNLKQLRRSITRRHNERQKKGIQLDYVISAPLQTKIYWRPSAGTGETSVYDSAPRVEAPPPPPPPPPPPATHLIQRGSWKTDSSSSNSSTESNRLSTLSTFSSSSGTEPDFDDIGENFPPPRPPRSSEAAARSTPPRIPLRFSERVPENMSHEHYVPCPTRALPQIPTQRHTVLAPPIARRQR